MLNNLYFVFTLIILGFFVYKKFAFVGNKNVKNISAEKAHELMKENKDILILDVRTPGEFKSGHIPGAKSVPVSNFASSIAKFEKYKDKPVIVHCASGGRSPSAVKVLLKNDFSKIYHMNHGLNGWKYGLK
ncbi:MAG: rhodanese-like domain-containing protein [Bacillota bacterium]|nr:rhodanese-like domain-containing protein [Bacillota bacterium]